MWMWIYDIWHMFWIRKYITSFSQVNIHLCIMHKVWYCCQVKTHNWCINHSETKYNGIIQAENIVSTNIHINHQFLCSECLTLSKRILLLGRKWHKQKKSKNWKKKLKPKSNSFTYSMCNDSLMDVCLFWCCCHICCNFICVNSDAFHIVYKWYSCIFSSFNVASIAFSALRLNEQWTMNAHIENDTKQQMNNILLVCVINICVRNFFVLSFFIIALLFP